jgi:hypothetical protein
VCVCVCVCARLSLGTGLKHAILLTKRCSPEIFECVEKRFPRRVGKLLAQTLLIHVMTLPKAPILQ